MKALAATVIAAGAALFASASTAEAQWGGYYGGYDPYGYGVYGPVYATSTPYRGSVYSGGFGTRNFSYGTTLPGGGVYGYSYTQPNYGGGTFVGPGGTAVNPNGGFSASAYGYSYPAPYAYPGYYYRPGHYTFFDN